jgi:pyruvate dehydrogenase E1 component alpha subunit
MSALSDSDVITSTHRGHGHAIAKGADIVEMFAELFGKPGGSCRGLGGSMHIIDTARGMLGANGIVGAGMPIALGAAFASKYRDESHVAVCFFGDGAANIGAFHETANMAAVLRLPLLMVVENNQYAEFTRVDQHMTIDSIAERGGAYGIEARTVDGMDVVAVAAAARDAVERARRGDGPTLLEASTYRYHDHQGVRGLRVKYREDAEVDEWRSRDPIAALEARLVEGQHCSTAELATIRDQVKAAVRDCLARARQMEDHRPDEDAFMRYVYRQEA